MVEGKSRSISGDPCHLIHGLTKPWREVFPGRIRREGKTGGSKKRFIMDRGNVLR